MLATTFIVSALWATVPAVLAFHNVTIQAQDTTDIKYNGTWASQDSYCTTTRYTSTVGSGLSLTFFGVAIYVIGTVDCDWSGLMSITLDGINTQFDRRACPAVQGSSLCEYPWFTADQLSNSTHTLTLTLIGPALSQAPAGHIISDFRYAIYSQLDPGDALWPPAAAAVTQTQTSASLSPSGSAISDSTTHKSSSTGPIIGGVVGGILAILIGGFLLFWFCRRRKQQADERTDLTGGPVTYGAGPAPSPWMDPAMTQMLHHGPGGAVPFVPGTPMTQASKEDLTRNSVVTPSSGLTTAEYQQQLHQQQLQQQQRQSYNPYAASSSSGDWNPYSIPSQGSQSQGPLIAQGVSLIPPRATAGGLGEKGASQLAPLPSASPSNSVAPVSPGGGGDEHEMVNRIAATVAAMMRGQIASDGSRSPPPQYHPQS